MSKVFRAGVALQFPVTGSGSPLSIAAAVETAFNQFTEHLRQTFPGCEVTGSTAFTTLRGSKAAASAQTELEDAIRAKQDASMQEPLVLSEATLNAGVDANADRAEQAA